MRQLQALHYPSRAKTVRWRAANRLRSCLWPAATITSGKRSGDLSLSYGAWRIFSIPRSSLHRRSRSISSIDTQLHPDGKLGRTGSTRFTRSRSVAAAPPMLAL